MTTYFEPFFGGGALFFHLKGSPKLLKWAGGKERILPQMLPHLPADLDRVSRFVLSDDNLRLVRTYKAVRDTPRVVIKLLGELTKDYHRDAERTYYQVRAQKPDVMADAELAAWFIFLNRTGYNGLYRVNSKGQFNVPFGKYVDPVVCDRERILAVSRALGGVTILHGDFASVMNMAQAGDFGYLDPPYMPLSQTSSFSAGYTGRKGGDAEERVFQTRIRDVALRLRQSGVEIAVSNSSSPFILNLYNQHFKAIAIQAARSINSKFDKRGPITEYLFR